MALSNGDRPGEGLELVAIGGGTGLSTLLSGLKRFVGSGGQPPIRRLSAIVAVSDDGGSSGRLRDELQMPPPGDIRNCIVALSEDSHLLSRLFRYRFEGTGQLAGHSFGNLFLAALSEVTGDFAEAVRLSSEILASKGHIFPATVSDVRIAAELEDGTVVKGETNISRSPIPIARLFLEPADCEPHAESIDAIRGADIITVGPGSLYTSLLPPLLVNGMREALASSTAAKFFISNLMTQPGETDGLTARRHLEIIREYAPELQFDHIVVNSEPISEEQKLRYKAEGAEQIGIRGSIDGDEIVGAAVIYADLLDDGPKVRHHPEKLAATILKTLQ